MKQVNIWIAVCPFFNEMMYRFLNTDTTCRFSMEIFARLESKIYEDTRKLKPGETYESILQSLWEYQKSLLPSGWFQLQVIEDGSMIITDSRNKENIEYYFYNPETRVITISTFDD